MYVVFLPNFIFLPSIAFAMDLVSVSLSLAVHTSTPNLFEIQPRWKPKWNLRFSSSATVLMPCKASAEQHRRSANYHPTLWEDHFIQSLKTPYTYECFNTRLEELKQGAKWLLGSTKKPELQLGLIDIIQRLGVAYHFKEEIKQALNFTCSSEWSDLYSTALDFRLRRQLHYQVSSDVFNKLKTREGRFIECLRQDSQGILSLYEASYLSILGEDVLEEAKQFTKGCLESLMDDMDTLSAKKLQHALAIPLHWRMLRLESRNFLDAYERDDSKNMVLLELAKLDFNLVQSIHQRDLIELSRWWKQLGFSGKLTFSRDRLIENFIWSMGIVYEPEFSRCRISLTKFVCIFTAIDDVYDVYGLLDELELFTEAVDRWDMNAIEHLPDYMKMCYSAMFSLGNSMAYKVEIMQGINVLPYIKKAWGGLCRSYLVEAKWFSSGYKPTLKEYLGNAWTSVGGPSAILHACVSHGETITNQVLDCLTNGSELVYWASLITRLNNDLGTSTDEMARGDVLKSIQCYVNEKGVSEVEAREHIRGLVSDSWKKLNEESLKSSLPKVLVNMVVNMARTSQTMYEHGDGVGSSDGMTKDRIISLFIQPIQIC